MLTRSKRALESATSAAKRPNAPVDLIDAISAVLPEDCLAELVTTFMTNEEIVPALPKSPALTKFVNRSRFHRVEVPDTLIHPRGQRTMSLLGNAADVAEEVKSIRAGAPWTSFDASPTFSSYVRRMDAIAPSGAFLVGERARELESKLHTELGPVYHSLDGLPSQTYHCVVTRQVAWAVSHDDSLSMFAPVETNVQQWHHLGKLHRENAPAHLATLTYNGAVLMRTEMYLQDGEVVSNRPCSVVRTPMRFIVRWGLADDVLYRQGGPAYTMVNRGQMIQTAWQTNPATHALIGRGADCPEPSVTVYTLHGGVPQVMLVWFHEGEFLETSQRPFCAAIIDAESATLYSIPADRRAGNYEFEEYYDENPDVREVMDLEIEYHEGTKFVVPRVMQTCAHPIYEELTRYVLNLVGCNPFTGGDPFAFYAREFLEPVVIPIATVEPDSDGSEVASQAATDDDDSDVQMFVTEDTDFVLGAPAIGQMPTDDAAYADF